MKTESKNTQNKKNFQYRTKKRTAITLRWIKDNLPGLAGVSILLFFSDNLGVVAAALFFPDCKHNNQISVMVNHFHI